LLGLLQLLGLDLAQLRRPATSAIAPLFGGTADAVDLDAHAVRVGAIVEAADCF